MEITTILWQEWLLLKRRFWRVTFSQMISSFLYFITFGMGLGRVVEIDGGLCLYYLIPGPLAMATMRSSYTPVSTRISVMRLHEESFEYYLYSPTRMYLLAMDHIPVGAPRSAYFGVFIVLLGVVSGARLAINGWLLTTVILNSLVFPALGSLVATMMENYYDTNNLTNIVITPMSFLCGTFFSLGSISEALRWVVNMTPLTRTARFIRETSFGGSVSWPSMASTVLFVTAFIGGCAWTCYRKAKVRKQGLWKKL